MVRKMEEDNTKYFLEYFEAQDNYFTKSLFGKAKQQILKGKDWLERNFPKLFKDDD